MNKSSVSKKLIGIRIAKWTYSLNEVFQGIVDYAETVGGWQLNANVENDFELEPSYIDKDWGGDGIILFRYSKEEALAYKAKGIPVVNLSREGDADWIPYVGTDNQRAGKIAAEHLLSLGLRNFATWSDPNRRYSRERVGAFTSRIEQSGYTVEAMEGEISKVAPSLEKWKFIHDRIKERVATLALPVGIFVKDDLAAITVVRACQELGLKVPDDVAVLGCSGDPVLACISNPPISSIARQTRQIGFEAARMLDQMMKKGPGESADRLIEPEGVVKRKSTEILAFTEPNLSKAIALIRSLAPSKNLRVRTICDELAISRTTLLNLFRDHLGCSPKNEIIRVRLDALKRQLEIPERPIKEIAYKMDFASPEELSRFFKQQEGCSPSKYRSTARVFPPALPSD